MDIKYIKVGKWYNVPFRVVEIKNGDIHMENGGIKAVCQPSELSEIAARQDVLPEHSTVATLSYPERVWNELWAKEMRDHSKSMNPDTENGTKNTETAPKYDPNREFRKGDIVRLREYNGRKPYDYWHKQVIKNFGAKLDTVLEDELDSGNVDIFQDAPIDELTVRVNSCHLELVTPIEELEPYCVKNIIKGYAVYKKGAGDLDASCVFWSKYHPNAKAAAEAERDRLNAEYRKEMEK